MRISDWSSDVCSSDLNPEIRLVPHPQAMDEDSLSAAVAAVDVVLDCSDNFSTREAVNAACVTAGKDRKSVVTGKSGSGRVDLGSRPIIKTKQYERDVSSFTNSNLPKYYDTSTL